MSFTKIIFAVIVMGMAVSTGFAVGIAAGATVIARITVKTSTERRILYSFGGICAAAGGMLGICILIKMF
ncbi:MAG: hypothetical protein ACLTJH_08215 [Lachnospiraceae bacterium]